VIKERDNNAQTQGAQQDAQRNAGKGLNKGKASDVDADNYSEYNIRPGRYREIYIHSKLMFVDDVFTTLGSANLNARSMVGDSEFNICTEEWAFTKAARKRVWGNLAGADLDGKTCTRAETAEVFDKWKRRMANNKDARSAGNPPENGSFIHPFEDPRGAPILRLV
jgi:phosphatidylserine/phosphatidylglycerophosphate/cardiolipin synthase-like enzyme